MPKQTYLSSEDISASSVASTILFNILASTALDEMSDYPGNDRDISAAERYLFLGRPKKTRVESTNRGKIVWFYPSGKHGPTETLEVEGTVITHGLLVTVEDGADVKEAERLILGHVPATGMAYLHVKAGNPDPLKHN